MTEKKKKTKGSRRLSAASNADRLPPHSVEGEQAIIGMMLDEPRTNIGLFIEKLKTPKAFYDLRYRQIYDVLLGMWDKGDAIDTVTLVQRLKEKDVLNSVGGAAHIAELVNNAPTSANFETHLSRLKLYHMARIGIYNFQEAINSLYDIGDLGERMEEAMELIEENFTKARVLAADTTERPISEIMCDTMELVENYRRGGAQVEGVLTGWHYLNKMLCGLRSKEMLVIAARPGMGKTSIAMNWAEYAAIERGHRVMLFSMEMAYRELGGRFLYGRAKRNYQMFRTGCMSNDDVEHLDSAAAQLSGSKMWLDDNMSVSISDIKAKIRRMVALHKVDFVIVDYLQLMTGFRGKRYGNRAEEVADISRNLKMIAKECDIALLVLSQMNRESERNVSAKPKLSDLRESGAIEQDADAVLFLYRPRLKSAEKEQFYSDMGWDPSNPPGWSEKVIRTDLWLEKNRNGPTGKAEFAYFAKYMKFEPYKRGTGIEPVKVYPRPGERNIELFENDASEAEDEATLEV